MGEGASAAPIHAYGGSKLATERLLRETALRHGLRHPVVRYFNVAGAEPLGRARPVRLGPRAIDHGRLAGRARPERCRHRVRRRLTDAGRDLRA